MNCTDVVPWTQLYSEQLVGNLFVDTLRERLTIHPFNYIPVFRFVVSGFGAGTVQLRIRAGFLNADADASSDTLLFPVLAANGGVSGQFVDTVTAGNGPLRVVPPRLSLFITTAAVVGLTGTWSLHVTFRTQR